jgi:hypothetical protein
VNQEISILKRSADFHWPQRSPSPRLNGEVGFIRLRPLICPLKEWSKSARADFDTSGYVHEP